MKKRTKSIKPDNKLKKVYKTPKFYEYGNLTDITEGIMAMAPADNVSDAPGMKLSTA